MIIKIDQLTKQRMSPKKQMIDELPDELLCLIISHLPFHEAVSTSVLSRRWKDIWRLPSRIQYFPKRSHKGIVHTIMSLQNNVIKVCKLQHLNQSWERKVLTSWIDCLARQKGSLEELSLESDYFYSSLRLFMNTVPKGLFHGEKLVSLKLRNCSLSHSLFEACVNLRTLKLENACHLPWEASLEEIMCHCSLLEKLVVKWGDYELFNSNYNPLVTITHVNSLRTLKLCNLTVTQKTLDEMLRHSPILENLVLKCCKIRSDCLSIQNHSKLRTLEIQDFHVSDLLIEGNALEVLKLRKFRYSKVPTIRCPRIKELSLFEHQYDLAREILGRSTGVIRGTGNGDLAYSMKDLRILCAPLDLNNDNIVLAKGLSIWNDLKKLDITNKICLKSTQKKLPIDYKFWEKRKLKDCLPNQLEVVRIREFRGRECEIGFASHLIMNCPKLRQLVIKWDDKCSMERATTKTSELLLVTRACSDICIIFKTSGKMFMYGNR